MSGGIFQTGTFPRIYYLISYRAVLWDVSFCSNILTPPRKVIRKTILHALKCRMYVCQSISDHSTLRSIQTKS